MKWSWRRRSHSDAEMRLARVVDGLLSLASQHTELLALLLRERETQRTDALARTREGRGEDAAEHRVRQWRGELSATWRGH